MGMKRRELLVGALGLNIASSAVVLAQQGGEPAARAGRARGREADAPRRTAKTTRLFKSPGMFPNALAVMTDQPGGLWIGQQKITAANTKNYNLPVLPDPDEAAWLVDWNGKLVKTVMTQCRNCSGVAYGNGCVWMGANAAPLGIFQVDMNGKQISHRQIPLGLDGRGGGTHGVKWHQGKLWIASTRMGGILRVDPVSWVPEVFIRVTSDEKPRLHDVAFDDEGHIWVVTGTDSRGYAEANPGLNKYDGTTGQLLMTVDFEPGSCDPHGLVYHEGRLVSCDSGIHPGWKAYDSPHGGYIFSIEIV